MKEPQNIVDYRRIDLALRYIDSHVREQPTLEVVAEAVGMSPFHFQKLFSRWAGISPKKFLQAISAERARAVLTTSTSTLEAAWKTGYALYWKYSRLFVMPQGRIMLSVCVPAWMN